MFQAKSKFISTLNERIRKATAKVGEYEKQLEEAQALLGKEQQYVQELKARAGCSR